MRYKILEAGDKRLDPSPPLNVFVYRPGAIGDTILTLPALAAIRRRFPGCEITYAGNSAMLGLLPVEQALSADDPRLLPLFQDPPRSWPGAGVHVIFARQPAGLPGIRCDPLAAVARGIHVADWLVDAILLSFEDRTPRIEVQAAPGKSLVIHLGAGSPAKRWPAGRFAALVEALGAEVAVVRGPADPPLELAAWHDVWHNLPLPELAGRLKGSRLFVGNDSGIAHLAAAVGVPTVAVYVATEPAVWGVRGPHTRQLQGNASVERALAACHELARGESESP